ncbi:MAG TPA: ABC transporter substrate-binding protein [Steroidobacteraceae bacterium]|nr:ABC transporter substrate-binding protein [Steroidobacteraceae bacterium]
MTRSLSAALADTGNIQTGSGVWRGRNFAALLLLLLMGLSDHACAEGSVIIGMQLEPPILDPTANPAAAISEALYGNVFEGLVQFSADGSVLPQLAESWVLSPDGLTYTFQLRQGVRFHDGTPFDAEAAKYSLDRVLAPDSVNPQKSRLQAIRGIEVIDAHTLRLSLSRRSGGLLQSLAWGSLVMVSRASAANNAGHPVGTGPFRFSEWRRGDSLTLVRNADYWGVAASLDRATFKFIADPSAAYAALMAGDVDAFDNYPAPESFAQFAADPRFAVFVGSTEMETILSLNNRRPPLNDLTVRRAIAHALDRNAVIDGAMFGYGTPIGSHFPPRNPAYVDLTGQYPHDIPKAKMLLAQAGYPNGFSVSLKLPPPSYARRGGEIIASQLALVGIRANIENLEWAQWLDQVYARHDFDMSIVGHAEPMDYDIYARDDYYFGYSNADFKALIASLDDTVDPADRQELLRRVQHQLADDAVNGYLFQYPRLSVWDAHFEGLGFDNVLSVVELKNAHYSRANSAPRGHPTAAGTQSFRLVPWLAAAAALVLSTFAVRRFGMAFLGRRLAVLIGTLIAATAVVFVVVQVVPGDPVRYMMGLQADPDAMSALRHQLGLDVAPLQRYFIWVGGLIHGDFGSSYTYRVPVGGLIAERLQVSLPLALYALVLSTVVAFPVGLIAAARRGKPADWMLTGLTQLGLAMPNFWLGLLLALLFAVNLHWVSAGGFPGWSAGVWPAIRALTLPAIALAMPQSAILARVLRGSLIETLHEDYIRTARAKGAGEWQVLWRHALPNALIPVLTILGMQFSFLLAGGVIIENVFFLPGLGRLVFQAIVQRDLIVVQSVVVMLVMAVVMVTFVVDLCYVLVNPRLRGVGVP